MTGYSDADTCFVSLKKQMMMVYHSILSFIGALCFLGGSSACVIPARSSSFHFNLTLSGGVFPASDSDLVTKTPSSAPVLILIHGLGFNHLVFDRFIQAHLASGKAKSLRVVAWTQRGFRTSPAFPPNATAVGKMQADANDLVEIMNWIGQRPIHLFTWSKGCEFAYALLNPEFSQSLTSQPTPSSVILFDPANSLYHYPPAKGGAPPQTPEEFNLYVGGYYKHTGLEAFDEPYNGTDDPDYGRIGYNYTSYKNTFDNPTFLSNSHDNDGYAAEVGRRLLTYVSVDGDQTFVRTALSNSVRKVMFILGQTLPSIVAGGWKAKVDGVDVEIVSKTGNHFAHATYPEIPKVLAATYKHLGL